MATNQTISHYSLPPLSGLCHAAVKVDGPGGSGNTSFFSLTAVLHNLLASGAFCQLPNDQCGKLSVLYLLCASVQYLTAVIHMTAVLFI